nr:hypothetical protein Iba_chr01dCG3570 [Ipomoea batatas]
MYPYLDFFNEPEAQEMEYVNDPEVEDQDLRSHLNARAGSDRTHPAEPPPQEPVNIIHESTNFPAPGVSPAPLRRDVTPNNPELRRVQSERRASMPYPEPPVQPRRPLEAQMESVDGSEYDSPPPRSAFDRLRPSARERLGVREEGRRIPISDTPSSRRSISTREEQSLDHSMSGDL